MTKPLTIDQIDERIADIEGSYYKGHKQNEEWWRIIGEVHPTDRRLWTFYNGLKNKRRVKLKEITQIR